MVYVAFSVAFVALVGASVYMVTTGHPIFGAMFFLAACCIGVKGK